MVEILDVDYNEHVDLVGTAHFTRRSISDAYEAIKSLNPIDVAFELDWRRFQLLNTACLTCTKNEFCQGLCEFTGAAEALGNTDANIWLIDMSEQEMRTRIGRRMKRSERAHFGFQVPRRVDENPIWLWENGFKDRVINNSKKEMQALRRSLPSVYLVLIDERNALMAAKLAWIVSKKLRKGEKPKILTFVGAAHVEGMRSLMNKPFLIKEQLRRLKLSFSKPFLIRRVAVH